MSWWLSDERTDDRILPPQQSLGIIKGGGRAATPDETALFYGLLGLRFSYIFGKRFHQECPRARNE